MTSLPPGGLAKGLVHCCTTSAAGPFALSLSPECSLFLTISKPLSFLNVTMLSALLSVFPLVLPSPPTCPFSLKSLPHPHFLPETSPDAPCSHQSFFSCVFSLPSTRVLTPAVMTCLAVALPYNL